MSANLYDAQSNGIAGNGVTDDTTALNALLASVAAAGGGIVFLGYGTYKLTATLQIPANVTLLGAGRGVTVLSISGAPSLSTGAVALTGVNAGLEHVQVNITDGDYRRGVDIRANNVRVLWNGVNVTSTSVGATFTGIYGAFTSDLSGAVIEYNDVTGSSTAFATYGFDGIITNQHHGPIIRGNYIHDVTGAGLTRLRWGIYCSGDSDGCLVEGNRVWNMGTSGIQVNNDSPSVGGDVYGRRIVGNSVYNCDHLGIAVDSGTATVAGNTVRQCEINFYTGATSTECVITGNTFTETEDGSGGSAIDVDLPMVALDGTHHTFSGNTIGTRGHSLIGVVVDGDYMNITGNNFGPTSPAVGIQTRTAAQYNLISGNQLGRSDSTSSNRRINLFGTGNVASGNRMTVPNASIGIRLAGTQNHAIGNVIIGEATATNGIWISGADCRYSENIISGSFSSRLNELGTGTPSNNDNHITY